MADEADHGGRGHARDGAVADAAADAAASSGSSDGGAHSGQGDPVTPADTCKRAPECTPGDLDSDTRGCGNCGTQTRIRSCKQDCTWGNYQSWDSVPCTGEGVCQAGEHQSGENQACGNCGHRADRYCDSTCRWAEWESVECVGSGVCAPGASEDGSAQACGNCGHRQNRVCTQTCSWPEWSEVACTDQGECAPGALQPGSAVTCGNCGHRVDRMCGEDCHYPDWATLACSGEGQCAPGTPEDGASQACGTMCGHRAARSCSAECAWPDWSAQACVDEGVCTPTATRPVEPFTTIACTPPGFCSSGIGIASAIQVCTSACGWSEPVPGPDCGCIEIPTCSSRAPIRDWTWLLALFGPLQLALARLMFVRRGR